MMDGEYFTPEELCREIGGKKPLSPRTLERWRRNGKGPPIVQIGNKNFYRKEAFRQWLLEQEKICSRPDSSPGWT
jgi:predicted site-specific integrase-resolvase